MTWPPRAAWIAAAATADERAARERSDFLAAVDTAGRVADFHALRHTFVTNLARSGVHPSVAQALARHSDIRLTLGTYTHSRWESMAEAVRRLPSTDAASPERQRATGTTDAPAARADFAAHFAAHRAQRGVKTHNDAHKPAAGERREIAEIPGEIACLPGELPSSGGGTRTPDTRIMIPLL